MQRESESKSKSKSMKNTMTAVKVSCAQEAKAEPAADPCIQGWLARAEAGEIFDLFCSNPDDSESTRAKHDGRQLTMAHFVGRAPVAVLQLRRSPDGQWRAVISPCAIGINTPDAPGRILLDLEDALTRWSPDCACGLGRKLLSRM